MSERGTHGSPTHGRCSPATSCRLHLRRSRRLPRAGEGKTPAAGPGADREGLTTVAQGRIKKRLLDGGRIRWDVVVDLDNDP